MIRRFRTGLAGLIISLGLWILGYSYAQLEGLEAFTTELRRYREKRSP